MTHPHEDQREGRQASDRQDQKGDNPCRFERHDRPRSPEQGPEWRVGNVQVLRIDEGSLEEPLPEGVVQKEIAVDPAQHLDQGPGQHGGAEAPDNDLEPTRQRPRGPGRRRNHLLAEHMATHVRKASWQSPDIGEPRQTVTIRRPCM